MEAVEKVTGDDVAVFEVMVDVEEAPAIDSLVLLACEEAAFDAAEASAVCEELAEVIVELLDTMVDMGPDEEVDRGAGSRLDSFSILYGTRRVLGFIKTLSSFFRSSILLS